MLGRLGKLKGFEEKGIIVDNDEDKKVEVIEGIDEVDIEEEIVIEFGNIIEIIKKLIKEKLRKGESIFWEGKVGEKSIKGIVVKIGMEIGDNGWVKVEKEEVDVIFGERWIG